MTAPAPMKVSFVKAVFVSWQSLSKSIPIILWQGFCGQFMILRALEQSDQWHLLMGKTWGRDVFIIGMTIMKWMWYIICTRKTSGHPCLENISMTHVYSFVSLTNWSRVTNICVSRLTIIGSDNGLSPGRRQAIIWTNDGILLIGPLGTNFS